MEDYLLVSISHDAHSINCLIPTQLHQLKWGDQRGITGLSKQCAYGIMTQDYSRKEERSLSNTGHSYHVQLVAPNFELYETSTSTNSIFSVIYA
jgi:hypothetical protein